MIIDGFVRNTDKLNDLRKLNVFKTMVLLWATDGKDPELCPKMGFGRPVNIIDSSAFGAKVSVNS